MDRWRDQLHALVTQGLTDHGPADVSAALVAESARAAATDASVPTPISVPVPVLGVDACPSGWVGVLLTPDVRPSVLVSGTVASLVALAQESAELVVVAIDIPIGLPDRDGREADVLARRELPGKASSVFSTLTRSAYTAPSYAEGRALNLAATDGRSSASAQAFALRTKILEVDEWVRSDPGVVVIEVHPEVSFARMAGAPLLSRKKEAAGVHERRAVLERAGIPAPAWFRGSGFGEDDLLDACAAAWTAVRHARRESESLPPVPEVFSDGIPAAIWV
jgi:predicted RNase H-like nuclease